MNDEQDDLPETSESIQKAIPELEGLDDENDDDMFSNPTTFEDAVPEEVKSEYNSLKEAKESKPKPVSNDDEKSDEKEFKYDEYMDDSVHPGIEPNKVNFKQNLSTEELVARQSNKDGEYPGLYPSKNAPKTKQDTDVDTNGVSDLQPKENKVNPDIDPNDTWTDNFRRQAAKAYGLDELADKHTSEWTDEDWSAFFDADQNPAESRELARSRRMENGLEEQTGDTEDVFRGSELSAEDLVKREMSRRKWNAAGNMLTAAVPELIGLFSEGKAGVMSGTRNLINAFFDGGPMSMPSSALAETLSTVDSINNRAKAIADHYGILQNADKKIVDSTIKGRLMQAQTKAEMKGIANVYAAINDQVEALGGDPLQITDEQLSSVTQHCRDRIAQLQANLQNQDGVAPAYRNKQERLEAQAELKQYQETLQGIEKRTKQVQTAQRQAQAQAKRDEKAAIDAKNLKRYDDGTDVQKIAWDLLGNKGGIELNEFGVPVDGQQIAALTKKAWFKMQDLARQGIKPTDPTYQAYQQLYDANNEAYKDYSEHRTEQGRMNRLKPDGTYGDYVSNASAVKEANQKLDEIFRRYGLSRPIYPEELMEMSRNGSKGYARIAHAMESDPEFIKWHNQLALNRNAINIKDISNKIRKQAVMRGMTPYEQEALIADLTRSQLEEADQRMNGGVYMPFDTDFNKKVELYNIAFDPANYNLLKQMQSKRDYLMHLRDEALKNGTKLDDERIKTLDWGIDALNPYAVDPTDRDQYLENTNIIREYMRGFRTSAGKTPKDAAQTPVPPGQTPRVPPTKVSTKDTLDKMFSTMGYTPKYPLGLRMPAYRRIESIIQNRLDNVYSRLGIIPGAVPQDLIRANMRASASKLAADPEYIEIANYLADWAKAYGDPAQAPSLKKMYGLKELESPYAFSVGGEGQPLVPPAQEPPKEENPELVSIADAQDDAAKDQSEPDEVLEQLEAAAKLDSKEKTTLDDILKKYGIENHNSKKYKAASKFAKKMQQALNDDGYGSIKGCKVIYGGLIKTLTEAVKNGDEDTIRSTAPLLDYMDELRSRRDFGDERWPKQGFWEFYKKDPEMFKKYVDENKNKIFAPIDPKNPDKYIFPADFDLQKFEESGGIEALKKEPWQIQIENLEKKLEAQANMIEQLQSGTYLPPGYGTDISQLSAAEQNRILDEQGSLTGGRLGADRKKKEKIPNIIEDNHWNTGNLSEAGKEFTNVWDFKTLLSKLGIADGSDDANDLSKEINRLSKNKEDRAKELREANSVLSDPNATEEEKLKNRISLAAAMYSKNMEWIYRSKSLYISLRNADPLRYEEGKRMSRANSALGQYPGTRKYYDKLVNEGINDKFSRNFIELVLFENEDSGRGGDKPIFGGKVPTEVEKVFKETIADNPNMSVIDLLGETCKKLIDDPDLTDRSRKVLTDLYKMHVPSEEFKQMSSDDYEKAMDAAGAQMKDKYVANVLLNREVGYFEPKFAKPVEEPVEETSEVPKEEEEVSEDEEEEEEPDDPEEDAIMNAFEALKNMEGTPSIDSNRVAEYLALAFKNMEEREDGRIILPASHIRIARVALDIFKNLGANLNDKEVLDNALNVYKRINSKIQSIGTDEDGKEIPVDELSTVDKVNVDQKKKIEDEVKDAYLKLKAMKKQMSPA